PLPVGEERRLPPRRQRVEPLLGLADRAGVLGVHVDAVRAAVELRGPEADQLAQLRVAADPVQLLAGALPQVPHRPRDPPRSAFPRREWVAAARAALADAPDHVLGYPDPRGVPQLRAALAGYLARTRGVHAAPERIVVCAGFAHGLALLCRLLRARGGRALSI